MQMYMFAIEVLQKSKYTRSERCIQYIIGIVAFSFRVRVGIWVHGSLLQNIITQPLPGTVPAGLGHLQLIFLEGYNCAVVGQGKCSKCDIDNATFWSKPVKGNYSYSGNVCQSKPDVHFNSHIDPCIS